MCAVCQTGGLCLSSSSSCVGLCLWFEALRVSPSGFNLSACSSWQPSSCWQHTHTLACMHTHTLTHRRPSIISTLSREPDHDRARGGGTRGPQHSPRPLVWLAQVIRAAGQEAGYELLL